MDGISINLPPEMLTMAYVPDLIEFHGSDGVEVKFAHFTEPTFLVQHVHDYDHTTFIIGKAELWCEGELLGTFENTGMTMKAHKHHAVQTLSSEAWVLCIHNTYRMGP